jgi:peptidoglycan/xylan/chitin deacetylase (PgdA/CDA1 family)
MRKALKLAVLYAGKALGLFALAKAITPNGLRILCYHGTAFSEESQFLPKLFMSVGKFERRLSILARHKFPVLRLGEAADRLSRGDISSRAVVITIDDGFYGTSRLAWPILQRFGYPATIYVTSYYAVKQNPVFGLVVEYMLWKTQAHVLDLDVLGIALHGQARLGDVAHRRALAEVICEYGETQCTEDERVAIAQRLGRQLRIDYDDLARSRVFSLMTVDEIRKLSTEGADFQAHTHRHRFPLRENDARKELKDNRHALEPAVDQHLEHFCYPSGEWFAEQWPWLEAEGFRTATTCEKGLNYAHTPRFALRRFLDGEHIAEIEFEAEVSGFMEVLRRTRTLLGGGQPSRPWRDVG